MKDFEDKWALVTGASSGIGAALARELAARRARLILTARRNDRLEALATELRRRGAEVRTAVADLNDPAAPRLIYQATEATGIVVEILINNAGLGQFGAFHCNPSDREIEQIRINCEAMVSLTRHFVPRMIERGRGWILITASSAGFQPVPYFTTYAATKAFDRFFALGLAQEIARYGVRVSALCPSATESEFSQIARAGAFRNRGAIRRRSCPVRHRRSRPRSTHNLSPIPGQNCSTHGALLARRTRRAVSRAGRTTHATA